MKKIMQNFSKKLFLAVVVALFSLHATAQDIYLDGSKLDKLEYKFVTGNGEKPFTTYRLNINESEKILFETGLESTFFKKKIQVSNPNSQSPSLVSAINSGRQFVYIAKKVADGYQVSLVGSAVYSKLSGDILEGEGSDYDFKVDLNNTTGNNVASRESRSAVYYVGDDLECGKHTYQIYRAPLETCRPSSNLVFIPEVGLVREAISEESALTTMELSNINGKSVCDFFARPAPPVQEEIVAVETPVATPYSAEVVPEPVADVIEVKGKPAPRADFCNEIAGENEHLIQKGDNLYAIARRYGISVTQLRRWNKLPSDTIYPCRRLVVVAPKEEILAAKGKEVKMPPPTKLPENYVPKNYAATKKAPTERKKYVNQPKPDPKPRITYQPKVKSTVKPKVVEKKKDVVSAKGAPKKVEPTTENVMFIKKGAGFYVVQKGDNPYSIAKKNNLTEEKLRCINGLSAGERILVGQVLKIEDCACANTNSRVVDAKTALKGDEPQRPVARQFSFKGPTKPAEATPQSAVVSNEVKNYKKYHLVLEGETLFNIARQHGLSVEKLRALNDLGSNEAIIPNQKLLLE
jgi:LysM repeat protein